MYPQLARTAGHPEEFRRALRTTFRPLLLVAVLGGVGTYLFADFAIGVIYGQASFGPAANILRAFAPALMLIYIDMVFGYAIVAAGKAGSLAKAKVISIVVGIAVELVLVSWFQTRFGNGGIGIVIGMAVGELIMVTSAVLLIRDVVERGMFADGLRALAAGAATIAAMRLLPFLPPLAGIPVCVAVFGLMSVVVGLVTRADVGLILARFSGRSPLARRWAAALGAGDPDRRGITQNVAGSLDDATEHDAHQDGPLSMSDGRSATARITVVIATYKRPDALSMVLSSLTRQTLDPSAFEVSVVIDGVDEFEREYRTLLDGCRGQAAFQLRYEFQANAGQSVARHRAITGSGTPWVCVIDDDMDLMPEFLASHLAALEAGGEKTVVIGRVIPEEGWQAAPLYEAIRTSHMLEWHEVLGSGLKQPTGYTLVTQNVAFGREFYLAVGGFDERLRLGEDSELGLRFEFAGGRFVFSTPAAAIHRSRVGSYDTWLRRSIEYGRSGVYIYDKLGKDLRAHPLRNLVYGSRLNAAAVHAVCWSDALAQSAIATLHTTGTALQRLGLVGPAIATHKAILAVAYHLGVKRTLGSWSRLLAEKRAFAAANGAPREPT